MSDALVYYTGAVVWKPPSIYKSFCPVCHSSKLPPHTETKIISLENCLILKLNFNYFVINTLDKNAIFKYSNFLKKF